MTPAQRHMGRVASIGCLICLLMGYPGSPAECHHIRTGQGGAQRASDFLVVPLDPEHHRGPSGIHLLGEGEFRAAYGVWELDLLAITIGILAGQPVSTAIKRAMPKVKSTARPSKILPRRV